MTQAVQQTRRTGEFDLMCSAGAAFPLFSPEGERKWIREWNPRPMFPDTIEFRQDTVFREGEAVWTIVDADWQTHRAEYVRVAPSSHTAHIVVKVDAAGADRSHVKVSYTVTIIGEQGASLLEAFSEAEFAAKMRRWQKQIGEHLESKKRA